MSTHLAGGDTYNLNSSIGSTDSIITLSSFLEPVSKTPYTMALLNSTIMYGTIAPRTSNSEFISFTGITQNADGTATLTGVTRGLAKKYPYTSSSTFKLPHSGQSVFILSDAPQVFELYASLTNDESFTGVVTFVQSPQLPTPSASSDGATKGYADSLAIAGAPDSSTTVKGIGKVSVAPASATNPIFVGDNDTRVPTAGEAAALVGNNTDIAVGSGNTFVTQTGFQKGAEIYGASSAGSDTYAITLPVVPTSYDNGRHYFIKVDVGNTGAATLNVNSLGAVSIVTGISTALVTGDMVANGIYELIYNSTGPVFQLVNPASVVLSQYVPIWKSGNASKNANDGSGAQNIAHGLGKIPKYIRITAMSSGSGTTATYVQAFTTYDGTTQTSYSIYGSASYQYDNTFAIGDSSSGGGSMKGIVTFDATNIIITWTKVTSQAGTWNLLWEAFA